MRHVGREEMERIESALATNPRIPRRKVETIVFSPSRDLGQIAYEEAKKISIRGPGSLTAKVLTNLEKNYDADLLSMLFFEGAYAKRLIDLGRNDALNRGEEIENFFGYPGIFYQVPNHIELGTWSKPSGSESPAGTIVEPVAQESNDSVGSTVPAPPPDAGNEVADGWIGEDGASPYEVSENLSSGSGAVEDWIPEDDGLVEGESLDHHDGMTSTSAEDSGFMMPPAPEVATGEVGIITTNGYTVSITSVGGKDISVTRVLHEELGVSLAEASRMIRVEGAIQVSTEMDAGDANRLRTRLEEAGATIEAIDVHGFTLPRGLTLPQGREELRKQQPPRLRVSSV